MCNDVPILRKRNPDASASGTSLYRSGLYTFVSGYQSISCDTVTMPHTLDASAFIGTILVLAVAVGGGGRISIYSRRRKSIKKPAHVIRELPPLGDSR